VHFAPFWFSLGKPMAVVLRFGKPRIDYQQLILRAAASTAARWSAFSGGGGRAPDSYRGQILTVCKCPRAKHSHFLMMLLAYIHILNNL